MKTAEYILAAALAVSAVSCAKVDPGTIDDPVSGGGHIMVTITVGRDGETKTSVSGDGKVSFTEDDRLTLLQAVEHASGETTMSLVKSTGTSLIAGGRRASFTFDLDVSGITSNDDITFRAATGEWNLESGSDFTFNVPSAISPGSYPGSLLPPAGVISVSEPILAAADDISDALNGSVRLDHMVNYGVLNVSGVPSQASTITGISVNESSGAGIVGPAYFDIKTGLVIRDISASELHITPSEEQQSRMDNGQAASIWFPSLPADASGSGRNLSFTVTLKDADNNQWQGQVSIQRSPDEPMPAPGSSINMPVGEWLPLEPES